MNKEWEEVPTEELWQDGEVTEEEVAWELFRRVCEYGDYIVMRKISDRNKPHPMFNINKEEN